MDTGWKIKINLITWKLFEAKRGGLEHIVESNQLSATIRFSFEPCPTVRGGPCNYLSLKQPTCRQGVV